MVGLNAVVTEAVRVMEAELRQHGVTLNLQLAHDLPPVEMDPIQIEQVIVNLLLMSVFAIQHSVMARKQFKRWWTQFVPASVERSTYVLMASLLMLLLFWQWRPLGGVVWSLESTPARALVCARRRPYGSNTP